MSALTVRAPTLQILPPSGIFFQKNKSINMIISCNSSILVNRIPAWRDGIFKILSVGVFLYPCVFLYSDFALTGRAFIGLERSYDPCSGRNLVKKNQS